MMKCSINKRQKMMIEDENGSSRDSGDNGSGRGYGWFNDDSGGRYLGMIEMVVTEKQKRKINTDTNVSGG